MSCIAPYADTIGGLIAEAGTDYYLDDATLPPVARAALQEFLSPVRGFRGALLWPIGELADNDAA